MSYRAKLQEVLWQHLQTAPRPLQLVAMPLLSSLSEDAAHKALVVLALWPEIQEFIVAVALPSFRAYLAEHAPQKQSILEDLFPDGR